MKLSDHWASYVQYTADLSQASRTASFAGIAVCWLLLGQGFRYSGPVVLSLALLVSFIALDLLQLTWASFLYRRWLRAAEKELQQSSPNGHLVDQELSKPAYLDRPAFCLFVAKTVTLLLGLLVLVVVVWGRIKTSPAS